MPYTSAGLLLAVVLAVSNLCCSAEKRSGEPSGSTPAAALPAGAMEAAPAVALGKAMFGRSGALRTIQAMPREKVQLSLEWTGERPAEVWYRWVPVLGTSARTTSAPLAPGDVATAPAEPGTYELEIGVGTDSRVFDELRLIVKVPFERKQGMYLQGYFIGRYPTEGKRSTGRYAPPEGFIEVTRANVNMKLSEHFRLREFLTHDQQNKWPKYVVVDPRLLDKLELVMAELNAMGVRAERMVVMSGYRTPQYNRKGLNSGRAVLSRHQYGDAADVWVDNDNNWYMDDLNGDGRRDTRDAAVILKAVERVEAKYPELVGGAGIYRDNGVHGPFIHIDARGKRARW